VLVQPASSRPRVTAPLINAPFALSALKPIRLTPNFVTIQELSRHVSPFHQSCTNRLATWFPSQPTLDQAARPALGGIRDGTIVHACRQRSKWRSDQPGWADLNGRPNGHSRSQWSSRVDATPPQKCPDHAARSLVVRAGSRAPREHSPAPVPSTSTRPLSRLRSRARSIRTRSLSRQPKVSWKTLRDPITSARQAESVIQQ
jgi:hypothetical protein